MATITTYPGASVAFSSDEKALAFTACRAKRAARTEGSTDRGQHGQPLLPCTGRFWEGRFKSQALLDEQALAACLAYVDLNPIRADMAKTPETSDHTSVQRRINSVNTACSGDIYAASEPLYPFVGNPREPMPEGLPFHLNDYLEFVDWTGRIIRDDKRGAISATLPPILERLDIDPKQWLFMTTKFESRFKSLVGCAYKLKKAAEQLRYERTPGISACKAAFG